MNPRRRAHRYLMLLACLVATRAMADLPSPAIAGAANDQPTLARIRDAALHDDWAYARLTDLTDLIGPRLTGSPGAAAAVEQVAATMRALGATVTLEPVKVPHWIRGQETAELVDYAGRPAGITQKIVLTAQGGSAATAPAGLRAPVLVVHSIDELKAKGKQVQGSIVLLTAAFDRELAERGHAIEAASPFGGPRLFGAQLAAKMGATAALVPSPGVAMRSAHTGAAVYDKDEARLPSAAISAEDALLIERLAARGPVIMHLTLTPQTLPDTDSFNVIADWPGTDRADDIVIASGHLDSWDLATGATDDGVGVVSALAVIKTLKDLNLHARRTIRVIAWMGEEQGGIGGQAYFAAHRQQLARHVAGVESDGGTGRPFGVSGAVPAAALESFAPLQAALQPIGAGQFERSDNINATDLDPLGEAGVPLFAPLVDMHAYFDYHHSPADTLDKVDRPAFQRNVALMSTLTWFLANLDQLPGQGTR